MRTKWCRDMQVEIVLPDLAAGPVTLSSWFADVGDVVYEGERLIEVLAAGATFDVSAPATGSLAEQRVFHGDRLHTGQVLGVVAVELPSAR